MPELPEVARTALRLKELLINQNLVNVIIHSGRYSRHGEPTGLSAFMEDLPIKIKSVDFFGKLIVFEFEGATKTWWCWNTLGMSGGWRSFPSKHGHVEFVTNEGSVWFTDVRNFGTMKFTDSREETEKKKKGIGPNHLTSDITDQIFRERLMKTPDSDICQALMNQTLIGGIGNYIKAEILYRSRISPHRKVSSLTESEFSRLNEECKIVIRSSFGKGGSSFKNYAGVDGDEGQFPFFFHVYGRDICNEGYVVKTEITTDGRTTHWVPEIQI